MKNIIGIVDAGMKRAEIIEINEFTGGLYWTFNHFTRTSRIIESARLTGNTARYTVRLGEYDLDLSPPTHSAGIKAVNVENGILEIFYYGAGGGGKSAVEYRSRAEDVIDYEIEGDAGSGTGGGKIRVPARKRVLVGIDDTDSPESGATWLLAWNIARELDSYETRFVSCSIVQLFPVEERTQNCVSSVMEFAILPDDHIRNKFIRELKGKVEKGSCSDETGMVWVERFDISDMESFSMECRKRRVALNEAREVIRRNGINVEIGGRGIIGATASLPFFKNPERGVKPEG